MGASLNEVKLIGHLGADPETRWTQSGKAVCNFRMATSEQWTDKQSGEKNERTEWHSITAFGRLGEVCGEYLSKGDMVYVCGKLRTEQYTDKEGVERYSTKIYVDEMLMLNTKGKERNAQRNGGQQQRGNNQQSNSRNQQPPAEQADFEDSDIPF